MKELWGILFGVLFILFGMFMVGSRRGGAFYVWIGVFIVVVASLRFFGRLLGNY